MRNKPKNDLEVKIEYTGVTGFRKSLLTIIPRLQKNEYLRFIITKHGKPAAVVMSYEAYDLLQSLAQELADQDENKRPEQRLAESYDRMAAKYGRPNESASSESAAKVETMSEPMGAATKPEAVEQQPTGLINSTISEADIPFAVPEEARVRRRQTTEEAAVLGRYYEKLALADLQNTFAQKLAQINALPEESDPVLTEHQYDVILDQLINRLRRRKHLARELLDTVEGTESVG